MSSVIDAQPWRYDATALAVPWHKSSLPIANIQSKRLTIGLLAEDPHFPLHPPVRRALDSAVKALAKQGHRIVFLENHSTRDLAYGSRLAFQYFSYGPHIDHISSSGEPPVTSVARASSPMFTGPPPIAEKLNAIDKISALNRAREAYSDAWRKLWVEHQLDVILSPGAQNTAVPHDTYGWPPYTVLWNLLDVSQTAV